MGMIFVALVITNCTNRKRKPIPHALHMADLEPATLPALASAWGERLAAVAERFPARTIYGGRAFQESAAVAQALNARFLVVSAGLGFIDASSEVPPYACTVLVGTADSIAGRITGPIDISAWWNALRSASPFAQPLASFLAEEPEPVLAALSDAYLAMIADELAALPDATLARVRIFTRSPAGRVAPKLRAQVMPYDDRLDGPDSGLRGTRSDFAARAMRHFVSLGAAGSVIEDAAAVEAALAGWRMSPKFERIRHDNAEILTLIRKHWDEVGGSSSKLLRLFRDDLGIACEQARFAGLARQVRGERA
jgi:hypothetical protein